ncbi:hypothetical protein UNSWDHB_1835 [Dehalobacter sp. UNSWDHB]|nr:hypothetical protein UNSWDHB_1835 [Dehalobacter sp. UNSWDHB]
MALLTSSLLLSKICSLLSLIPYPVSGPVFGILDLLYMFLFLLL